MALDEVQQAIVALKNATELPFEHERTYTRTPAIVKALYKAAGFEELIEIVEILESRVRVVEGEGYALIELKPRRWLQQSFLHVMVVGCAYCTEKLVSDLSFNTVNTNSSLFILGFS